MQSGRFIGQDWRRFAPWVQYLMPMDYRSHFAGDFETHLDLLAESIQQQKVWAADFPHLWIGVAAYQLYDAERVPLDRLRRLLREGGSAADMQAEFEKVAPRLKAYAPDLHDAIVAHLRQAGDAEALAAKIDAFVSNMPAGYAPPDRLTKTLDTVRAQGVEGVVIFSTGGLTAGHLWDAVEAFFGR